MENQASDPLGQLRKLVVSQKTAVLPDMPPDPGLQALNRDIVAYDRHVSETVIGVLGGSTAAQPYPQQTDLQEQLDDLRGSGEQHPILELYQRYKDRLDRMLDLSIQVAKSRA